MCCWGFCGSWVLLFSCVKLLEKNTNYLCSSAINSDVSLWPHWLKGFQAQLLSRWLGRWTKFMVVLQDLCLEKPLKENLASPWYVNWNSHVPRSPVFTEKYLPPCHVGHCPMVGIFGCKTAPAACVTGLCWLFWEHTGRVWLSGDTNWHLLRAELFEILKLVMVKGYFPLKKKTKKPPKTLRM